MSEQNLQSTNSRKTSPSNFHERFEVRSIDADECKEWLLYKHYAHRLVNIVHAFGLYDNKILVGVCTYGMPLNDNCCLMCGPDYKENVLELNRLIKNDGLPNNIQTWFVAQTFKILPKPFIVLSYSDPNNGHNGYTYQALNFMYTGKGGYPAEYIWNHRQITGRNIMEQSWWRANNLPFDKHKTVNQNFIDAGGTIIPQMPKNRYVLFLGSKTDKRKMRSLLKWPVEPYPKGENKYYDTSFQCTVNLILF